MGERQRQRCTGVTLAGEPCKQWAQHGEDKCVTHLRDRPRCGSVATETGEPCKQIPLPGKTVCFVHVDPQDAPKPKCPGTSRSGEPCKNYPVAGLPRCAKHMRGMPNEYRRKKSAEFKEMQKAEKALERAMVTYGLRRDVSAVDALLEEVQWTAGAVAWLREQVQKLTPEEVIWGTTEEIEKTATEFAGTDTTRAARIHVYVELYMRERKHLVDVTTKAIAANLDERRVRLAESQSVLVNRMLRAIFADLGLTPAQQVLVGEVVPRHLRALTA